MQERLMKEVEERTLAAMRAMEPEAMVKTWLPARSKALRIFRRCSGTR